jgi:hypothetical protein
LRSELRLKTKPLIALLTAVDAMSAVQTAVPNSVLGGDIFALMNGRLRQLLLYDEQREAVMEAAPASRSRFAAQTNGKNAVEKEGFSLHQVSPKKSAKQFISGKPAWQKRDQAFSSHESGRFIAPTASFITQPVPEVAPSSWEAEPLVSENNPPSRFDKDNPIRQHDRDRQAMTSLFVAKLEEYWRLSQQEPIAEQNKNAAMRMAKEGGKSAPAFSAPMNKPVVAPTWPEMTGQQIAQKLHAFVSGRGAAVMEQMRQANTPEQLEIRNVFNIEVKTGGKSGAEAFSDLSEKIADILREQALQHGIDIT